MDYCAPMGADAAPAATPAAKTPTPTPAVKWYEQPVDWVLDLVGNVSYYDDDIRLVVKDGELVVDRSDQTPKPVVAPVRAPAIVQQIPPAAWWTIGGLVAFMLLRK